MNYKIKIKVILKSNLKMTLIKMKEAKIQHKFHKIYTRFHQLFFLILKFNKKTIRNKMKNNMK